jgi:CheY-like chemotaxis protein
MPVLDISKKIGDALITLLKGTGDVVSSTIDVTRDVTARTLRGIKNSRNEAPRVATQGVMAAIKAGSEAGAEIGSVVKGAVIGTIQGVSEVTKVTPVVLSDIARASVKGAKVAGEDVTVAARKAVEGAIEAGRKAGVKAEDAASAAATGAISASSEFSDALASAVAKSLSGTIAGVRIVLQIPSKKHTVLVVNGNRHDLYTLGQQLEKEGYRVHKALSVKESDKVMQTVEGKISLALVDVSELDQGIWENCQQLQKAKIPFLVISAKRSPTIQQESIKCGASGVLLKPLGVKELVEHMRSLIGD